MYVPVVDGEPSEFGSQEKDVLAKIPQIFEEALRPEVVTTSQEGKVFSRTAGYLQRHTREPAPVVPEWDVEGLSLAQQLQMIESRGPVPISTGKTSRSEHSFRFPDGESTLSHFDASRASRPSLYPLAREALYTPDGRGMKDGQAYYFKRIQALDGTVEIFMVITSPEDDGKESLITWYRVDKGTDKANNPIREMIRNGTMKWFL